MKQGYIGDPSAIKPDELPPNHKAMHSTKRFGHDRGISCAFRQWSADSHCHFIHGYALSFTFTFAAQVLDERNWVVDFGSCAFLEHRLRELFDHKLLVAQDDPQLDLLAQLGGMDAAHVVIVPAVGCEAFAKYAYDIGTEFLQKIVNDEQPANTAPRVWLASVEVAEHGANSAICFG